MKRVHGALGAGLAALVVLSACQATIVGPPHRAIASSGAADASPEPGASTPVVTSGSHAPVQPTGSPAASGSPGASPAALADLPEPQMLVKPSGATSLLSGVATLDASYIVAAGGGNFIGHNGSAIVAAGGGNFISHNGSAVVVQSADFIGHNGGAIVAQGGGNIVAQGGGNIVAQGGGNFIGHNGGAIVAQGAGNVIAAGGLNLVAQGGGNFVSEGGGAIVAQGGGNIVAQGGGNIVAQGGGNIVAQGGGNIVAQGAGNFRLLDIAVPSASPSDAATTLPTGTVLPAVGVRISVISLATNMPVPIGQDANGKPVYTVYTNADGKYDLYLPAAEKDNVQVVANVRDVPQAANPLADPNPRFRYDVIGSSQAASDVDEDRQVLSQFIVEGATAQLAPYLSGSTQPGDTDHQFGQLVSGLLKPLEDAGIKAGYDHAPPEFLQGIARRLTQIGLQEVPLDNVPIAGPAAQWYTPEPSIDKDAYDTLLDIMKSSRLKLANFLPPARTDYIEQQGYFQDALCQHLIPPDFRIVKSSDLGKFIVMAYLSRPAYFTNDLDHVLQSIGNDDLPPAAQALNPGKHQSDRLDAAGKALIINLVLAELSDPSKAVAYIAAHPYTGAPTPSASPAPTCAP